MEKFFYRVQKGDCILSICKKFNISMGRLIFENGLKKEISAGDILFIEKSDKLIYQINPTDTLEDLAKKFNIQKEMILKNNHIPYIFCGMLIEI